MGQLSLTDRQQRVYDQHLRLDWEFYEMTPLNGLVCMRKERWYGTESMSWEYITIKKDGSVVGGNKCCE